MNKAHGIGDMKEILEACDHARGSIVPCFLGGWGIGKSEAVYQFAEEHGRDVVLFVMSQRLPTEISGITMPDNEEQSMKVFDYDRLTQLKDGDILFFDELLEAPEQTLKACLTLIQERRMLSGKKLPDVLIVAASNPCSTPTLIKASIRERFMFVNVEWNSVEWAQYIEEKYRYPVSDSIIREIEVKMNNDTVWNTITPRSMTKLIDLYANNPDKGKAYRTILRMYDNGVAILVRNMFHVDDINEGVVKIIDDHYDQMPEGSDIAWTSIFRSHVLKADVSRIMDIIDMMDDSLEIHDLLESIDSDTVIKDRKEKHETIGDMQ